MNVSSEKGGAKKVSAGEGEYQKWQNPPGWGKGFRVTPAFFLKMNIITLDIFVKVFQTLIIKEHVRSAPPFSGAAEFTPPQRALPAYLLPYSRRRLKFLIALCKK
ncbi:MAG: hypothetical protein HY697_03990 [Deltaproteobacteria bacterium]|nr:hypothetical protein [Deltaproteobacteria bacterium]